MYRVIVKGIDPDELNVQLDEIGSLEAAERLARRLEDEHGCSTRIKRYGADRLTSRLLDPEDDATSETSPPPE